MQILVASKRKHIQLPCLLLGAYPFWRHLFLVTVTLVSMWGIRDDGGRVAAGTGCYNCKKKQGCHSVQLRKRLYSKKMR
jgi:hypothetical protein